MFTKEFLFEEILRIWDFIMEKQEKFKGMDFVALAMLVWGREYGKREIVKGENFEILHALKGGTGQDQLISVCLQPANFTYYE